MNKNLDDYNRMRDFSATAEPAAKPSSKKKRKTMRCNSASRNMMPRACTTTFAWNSTAP